MRRLSLTQGLFHCDSRCPSQAAVCWAATAALGEALGSLHTLESLSWTLCSDPGAALGSWAGRLGSLRSLTLACRTPLSLPPEFSGLPWWVGGCASAMAEAAPTSLQACFLRREELALLLLHASAHGTTPRVARSPCFSCSAAVCSPRAPRSLKKLCIYEDERPAADGSGLDLAPGCLPPSLRRLELSVAGLPALPAAVASAAQLSALRLSNGGEPMCLQGLAALQGLAELALLDFWPSLEVGPPGMGQGLGQWASGRAILASGGPVTHWALRAVLLDRLPARLPARPWPAKRCEPPNNSPSLAGA